MFHVVWLLDPRPRRPVCSRQLHHRRALVVDVKDRRGTGSTRRRRSTATFSVSVMPRLAVRHAMK
eukprot:2878028-Heterocapsa_arctica.AAC.1